MRILILREVAQNSIDDIYGVTDYLNYEYLQGTNVGNKMWFSGLISTISTKDNEIFFLTEEMDSDYINNNFDMCIKPEANIFQPAFVKWLDWHVERFKNVKIPIYVIACGVQASSYDKLDELVELIKVPAVRFIKSIYATGGEFALRGFFSYEFFRKLGFSTAVVTGCPSLYQAGKNLKIKKIATRENFKPAVNGDLKLCRKALLDYNKSEFFDQGLFYLPLYKDKWKMGGGTIHKAV